jgi:hypothetical protein
LRRIDRLYVHHSASPSHATTIDRIDGWHRDRGWDGVGYHYVIHPDGSIHQGRDPGKVGAHCRGHNSHSIGVCVCGNFMDEAVSPEMASALDLVLTALMSRFGLGRGDVYGHRESGSTLCPGDMLYDHLCQWRDDAEEEKDG